MIALWLGIGLLTLLALCFIFYPFMRAHRIHRSAVAETRQRQNIDIFNDRLSELENELNQGVLDQDTFNSLKLELEKNLLIDAVEDVDELPVKPSKAQFLSLVLIGLIVVTASMGMYMKYGRAPDLEIAMNQDPFDGRTPTMEEALSKLEQELEARPNNAEGWYMLASSYMNLGRFTEGADALQQVLNYLPDAAGIEQRASITGLYAQALFFKAGNKVTPEVQEQLDKALALDSFEVKALGLLGIAAFEQQQYQTAIDYWVKALTNAEGNAAESLRAGIARATDELKAIGATAQGTEIADPVQIRVQVQVSEALKDQVTADQHVFIFAKAENSPMPLAAVKLTVADLPTEVVLDDSLAMMPTMKLSSVNSVNVSARISKSGLPQSQPGDLVGNQLSVPVRGQKATLELVIDELVQ